MEPWLQMVVTIVCAVIASSGFWAFIQRKNENLRDYLYKPYEKLGGNGSAQKVMIEVNKLPIHTSTYQPQGGDET